MPAAPVRAIVPGVGPPRQIRSTGGTLPHDRPEVAAGLEGRAKFVKIDVDDNPGTARSFGVSSIPTFAVVRDGQVVHQFSGSRPKGSFAKEVEKAIG